jgi:hypothetical protein
MLKGRRLKPHVDRPLTYIAGPYAHPDPVENTHTTIDVADELQTTQAITAYVPHLSLLWHVVCPHPADYWYDYDLAILARCDALLRLPGDSVGADNEVLFAEKHHIPVFYEQDELLDWASTWH